MTLQQQVSEQLVAKFGDKVFDTIIPRNVRLAEAPSYGLPGVVYDRASKGAQAYVSFGAEMIRRVHAMERDGLMQCLIRQQIPAHLRANGRVDGDASPLGLKMLHFPSRSRRSRVSLMAGC